MTESPQPHSAVSADQRIASLDFIRGIAVMGILVANIIAFGQPMTAYMYPTAFTVPAGALDDWLWVAQFVLVDGKMRGLFTLLFGAGMILFLERARAKGAGVFLQVRRLLWLGLIGLAHYVLVWRGDILHIYALIGLIALLFVDLPRRMQLALGLVGYIGGSLLYTGMLGFLPFVTDGAAAIVPDAGGLAADLEAQKIAELADGQLETRLIEAGHYWQFVTHNWREHLDGIPFSLFLFGFETLPLMLLGMALYRYGLFEGAIAATRMRRWGWGGLFLGTALTLPIALWVRSAGFTYYGTLAAMAGWGMLPRLPVILGLAALLALWGRHADGWLGERIGAAGRAAFTNYLGTSLLMLLVFHGWALGQFGKFGRLELYGVALVTCAIMLAWSKPWLDHFRFGPLEWLWRCLTYGRFFRLRR